jgi:hypothetical protein
MATTTPAITLDSADATSGGNLALSVYSILFTTWYYQCSITTNEIARNKIATAATFDLLDATAAHADQSR